MSCHSPLECGGDRLVVAERQHLLADDLAGFVALAGDQQHVAGTQVVDRGGNRLTAVTDLEPYLGAFGHLVALRLGDLTYLHVHPDAAVPTPTDRSGPGIAFTAEVPSAGTYRLFLDFRHLGTVRTAEFTVLTREAS